MKSQYAVLMSIFLTAVGFLAAPPAFGVTVKGGACREIFTDGQKSFSWISARENWVAKYEKQRDLFANLYVERTPDLKTTYGVLQKLTLHELQDLAVNNTLPIRIRESFGTAKSVPSFGRSRRLCDSFN